MSDTALSIDRSGGRVRPRSRPARGLAPRRPRRGRRAARAERCRQVHDAACDLWADPGHRGRDPPGRCGPGDDQSRCPRSGGHRARARGPGVVPRLDGRRAPAARDRASRSSTPRSRYDYFPALRRISAEWRGCCREASSRCSRMGRALARKPSVLLLDELSLGLAPLIVQNLLPVVRSYATEHRCAVLLVEQHVHLALGIADRAYLMANGVCSDSHDAHVLRHDMTLVQASYLGGPEWAGEFQHEAHLPFIGEETHT